MAWYKNKVSLAAFATALACAVTLPLNASAESVPISDGWYLSGFGGAAITPNISDNTTATKFNYKDPGWQAAGELGYRSGPMRYAGEGIYMQSRIKDINVAGTTIPGAVPGVPGSSFTLSKSRVRVTAGLMNVYYDFEQISPGFAVNPYLGLGIGYAHISNKAVIGVTPAGSATNPVTTGGNDNEFAYQGIAGFSYHIDSVTSLIADYRYFATTKAKRALGNRFQNHTFNIGLSVQFDSPQA